MRLTRERPWYGFQSCHCKHEIQNIACNKIPLSFQIFISQMEVMSFILLDSLEYSRAEWTLIRLVGIRNNGEQCLCKVEVVILLWGNLWWEMLSHLQVKVLVMKGQGIATWGLSQQGGPYRISRWHSNPLRSIWLYTISKWDQDPRKNWGMR